MPYDIYWIDDYSGQILSIVGSVFPTLWERECSQYVFQIDNYKSSPDKKSPLSKEDLKIMKESIAKTFRDTCRKIDDRDWLDDNESFNKLKSIVSYENGLANIISIIPLSEDSERKDTQEIDNIIMNWSNIDKLQSCNGKETLTEKNLIQKNMSILPLLNAMDIPESKTVALDICLLERDDDNIINRKGPCLSMAIYDYLVKQKHCNVFLYTIYSYENQILKGWCEIYSRLFNDNTLLSEDVIHQISKLTDDGNNSVYINELCKMVGKKMNK